MKKRASQYKIRFCREKGLFLLIIVVFCQCSNKRFKADSQNLEQLDCGWYGTMKVEERRKLFPFDNAKKVLLISYSNFRMENDARFQPEIKSITTTPWGDPLPIVNAVNRKTIVDTFRILRREYLAYEVVALNQTQIDSLSHLVFNYKLGKKPPTNLTMTIKGCYSPRNCILFFDKDNIPILNVEICFECKNMYYYSPPPQNAYLHNSICSKIDLFKAFFKQNNIHYGVD